MSHSRSVKGLTLIEVVVVLAILAVLAGVAVRSLEPIADQTRFEVTQRTLDLVEDAIIQDARLSDGTRQISGFVSDIGRLPQSTAMLTDNIGTEQFVQVDPPVNVSLSSFPIADRSGPDASDANNPTDVDCTQVSIRCGWRGPYVTVSDPTEGIVDGWGRPIALELNATESEARVLWSAITPQYNDQVRTVQSQAVSGRIRDTVGDIVNAEVALVYPDPIKTVTGLAVMEDADGNDTNDVFRFDNVPVGTRALVFRQSDGTQFIRYIEVTPMQPLNIPITL